ncbi:N-acetylglucosamine-6-phosphate deacetylase [Parvularcula lutaonensis]|uniref:N-acetylglucosamine-6-phosphate deacetylase n=1 Tax=Parvularcula lutaonensis TaxID=491923 RepID=A0ABV7M8M4_9PROT|nr:N-acetylglucosamine-6-phosphate deacetylase [Parvularcula lutaonensis]
MTPTALIGGTLLLPDRCLEGHALVVSAGKITKVCANADLPAGVVQRDIAGLTVAPGFIDLQVNGGGGVLFNDDPSLEAIKAIGAAHRNFGTTSFLPTLISDTVEKIDLALIAAEQGLAENTPGLIGIHLEGPFLSPQRHGIHNPAHFQTPDAELLDRLKAPKGGSLMMTLAPEEVPAKLLRQLSSRGVKLAAGHTAATYAQTVDALKAGVTGFTHLFNAMPPMLSRAPGPVAAALESEAWCTLIADGHHVDDAMLRLAIRAKADGRMIFVTDAMSCAGTDATSFQFDGKTIRVRDGRCEDDAGTLAGSNLTMIDAVRRGVRELDLPLHIAVNMATFQPASFLGIEAERGSLKPGSRADLVFLNGALDLVAVVQDGNLEEL